MINERRAFGERLRRQRERQHVTLDEIAEATKVAASLFAGLERGDCSRWPGGFYSRSFIRGYAAAIQLDPTDTAAEFAEYYDAADATIQPVEAVAAKTPPRPPSPPLRLSLETDPQERYRQVARRAAHAIADLLVIGLLAYGIVLSVGVNFWLSLSLTTVGFHLLSRLAPVSAGRRPAAAGSAEAESPTVPRTDEAPVGGTASTIA